MIILVGDLGILLLPPLFQLKQEAGMVYVENVDTWDVEKENEENQ